MSAIQSMLAGYGASSVPISLIANQAATGSDTTNVTAAIDTTGASLLTVLVAYLNTAPPVITDSKGNTWTPRTEYDSNGANARSRLYYAENPIVGSGHTFTASAALSYNSIAVAAFNNTALASVYDVENGAGSASATTLQPGSVTPSANNSLLVTGLCFVATSGAATINSGFTVTNSTVDANCFAGALAYKVQTTAGAENPTWTSPSAAERMSSPIAAFKHV